MPFIAQDRVHLSRGASHIGQRGNHDVLVQQSGWYRDMYRYQQLEAALDDAPEIREEAIDA
nr:multidrug transporter [Escherichia coli]